MQVRRGFQRIVGKILSGRNEGQLYTFCGFVLTGILVNKFSTSSEARIPLFGSLDTNMPKNLLGELMVYILVNYGNIPWFTVFAN